jgi:hypothetical protein
MTSAGTVSGTGAGTGSAPVPLEPPVTFTAHWRTNDGRNVYPRTIVLVGAGGTGARMGAILPRLVQSYDTIIVMDPDVVEHRNLLRQHFVASDVGRPKADIVARRLMASCPEGVRVRSVVAPFSSDAMNAPGMDWDLSQVIILGCVDNYEARLSIRKAWRHYKWWIDAGNDIRYGQVVLSASQAAMAFSHPRHLRDMAAGSDRNHIRVSYDGILLHAPSLLQAPPSTAAEACGVRLDTQTVGANNTAATIMGNVLAELLDELPITHTAYEFSTSPTMITAAPMRRPDPLRRPHPWDVSEWQRL